VADAVIEAKDCLRRGADNVFMDVPILGCPGARRRRGEHILDPTLVIFAIESAIRLGIKINEVLLDETSARTLVLPLSSLFGDINEAKAAEYFDHHHELVKPGGIYADPPACSSWTPTKR